MKYEFPIARFFLILSILSCLPTSAYSPTVYDVVAFPNTKLQTCTVGAVWRGHHEGENILYLYREWATHIARNYSRPRYKFVEVFIFEDMASAVAFRDYQAKRQSKSLQASDYRKLNHLWGKTLAYCALTNRTKTLRTKTLSNPKRKPSWWHTLPNIAVKKQ